MRLSGFGSSAGGEGGLGGTVEPSSDGGSEELRNKAAKEREQFYAERETNIAAKKKQALRVTLSPRPNHPPTPPKIRDCVG